MSNQVTITDLTESELRSLHDQGFTISLAMAFEIVSQLCSEFFYTTNLETIEFMAHTAYHHATRDPYLDMEYAAAQQQWDERHYPMDFR